MFLTHRKRDKRMRRSLLVIGAAAAGPRLLSLCDYSNWQHVVRSHLPCTHSYRVELNLMGACWVVDRTTPLPDPIWQLCKFIQFNLSHLLPFSSPNERTFIHIVFHPPPPSETRRQRPHAKQLSEQIFSQKLRGWPLCHTFVHIVNLCECVIAFRAL